MSGIDLADWKNGKYGPVQVSNFDFVGTALIKDYDNCKDFYNNASFLKSTGNNPYLQEVIPIERKGRQKI